MRVRTARAIQLCVLLLAVGGTFETVLAGQAWETDIIVTVRSTGTRITVGQHASTQGADVYDVPAPPGILLNAFFIHDGKRYQKSVKRSDAGVTAWDLQIDCSDIGEDVVMKWDSGKFPAIATVRLIDLVLNKTVDMRSKSKYSYTNKGLREFRIEVGQ